ncbi:MAG TPA: SCP2 sterol-binding domain-containing protein [Nitrososphaerales archaeon]|nr:SCP2 sterol-binding domain-containing protein [Nitrososphaerales archaeon]
MVLRLRKFLDELLDVLREDYPKQLSRLIKDANGLTYLQVLDKERAVITVRNRKIAIASKARKDEINVRVYISKSCLFDVLEGKLTLAEAFETGELRVFGSPQTLLRCYAIWERVISLARTSPRFYFLTYELR